MPRFQVPAAVLLLVLAAGCITEKSGVDNAGPPTPPDPGLAAEDEKIREAYDRMRTAVLDRDARRIFSLLSSSIQRRTQWEVFEKDYPKLEPHWLEFFRDAKFLTATHDADEGNAFLKFRDGTQILGLVLENGEWRINRLVPLPRGS